MLRAAADRRDPCHAKAEMTVTKAKKGRKGGEPVELSGKAVRHLRGLGHALDPLVSVGKNGITDALVAQTARALLQHELVKVRVQGEAPVDRKEAGPLLAAATRSSLAQVLGRTFLLYKAHPEKPRIVLPVERKGRAPAREPGEGSAPDSED
jgi:RNA-binding protein